MSCLSSISDMAHTKKNGSVTTIKQQQLERPEFYCCIAEKGWFWKTCVSFSGISTTGVAYITKAGIFGDHCSQRTTGHFVSEHHKEAIKNKYSYDTSQSCSQMYKYLENAL